MILVLKIFYTHHKQQFTDMYVLHVIESLFAKMLYQNCNGVGQQIE